jgi:hypothetical protein
MAESIVNVTEGSGKKLHTFNRTIGANSVEDEVILNGEPYLATYGVSPGALATTATANSHMLQIMAGASLHVYVRWIRVYQMVAAGAFTVAQVQVRRLTTAGTGGTAGAQAAFDSGDAAAGATSMTLPTVKGTETVALWDSTMMVTGAAASGTMALVWEFDADRMRTKAIRIPAGTANGICLKNITAVATATFVISALISEANF